LSSILLGLKPREPVNFTFTKEQKASKLINGQWDEKQQSKVLASATLNRKN
jgi:hypothetical protein